MVDIGVQSVSRAPCSEAIDKNVFSAIQMIEDKNDRDAVEKYLANIIDENNKLKSENNSLQKNQRLDDQRNHIGMNYPSAIVSNDVKAAVQSLSNRRKNRLLELKKRLDHEESADGNQITHLIDKQNLQKSYRILLSNHDELIVENKELKRLVGSLTERIREQLMLLKTSIENRVETSSSRSHQQLVDGRIDAVIEDCKDQKDPQDITTATKSIMEMCEAAEAAEDQNRRINNLESTLERYRRGFVSLSLELKETKKREVKQMQQISLLGQHLCSKEEINHNLKDKLYELIQFEKESDGNANGDKDGGSIKMSYASNINIGESQQDEKVDLRNECDGAHLQKDRIVTNCRDLQESVTSMLQGKKEKYALYKSRLHDEEALVSTLLLANSKYNVGNDEKDVVNHKDITRKYGDADAYLNDKSMESRKEKIIMDENNETISSTKKEELKALFQSITERRSKRLDLLKSRIDDEERKITNYFAWRTSTYYY